MAEEIKKDVVVDFKVQGENKAQKATKDLNKETKNVKNSQENLNKTTQKVGGSLDRMTGGAITGFKSLVSGVKSGVTAFKSLRMAIIATGLGALVVVIASVAAAFRGSEEGQNKFNKILSVTGAIVGNLVDLLADFGDAIISAVENPKKAWEEFTAFLSRSVDFVETAFVNPFIATFSNLGLKFVQITTKARIAWNEFTGDHEEAEQLKNELDEINEKVAENEQIIIDGAKAIVDSYNNAKDAVTGFVEENIKEGKEAARVADMRAKADKIERRLLVERATLENEIAQERLKARQEDQFTAEERRKSLLRAQELEEQLLSQEKEALELRAEAQSLENTFARSTKENLDEEARLKAAVIQQEAKRTNAARTTQRELNRVNNEIIRDEKAKAKILQAIRDGEQDDKIAKINNDEQNALKELERLKATEEEKEDVREFYRQQRIDREEEIRLEQEEKLLEIQKEEKERLQEKFNSELEQEKQNFQTRFDLLQQQRQQILNNEKINEDQRTALLKANSDARVKVEEAETQARQQLQDQVTQNVLNGAAALGDALGFGKEVAIAGALINTFEGIAAGVKLGFPLAIPAVAAATATGFAAVKNITSTDLPAPPQGATGGRGRSSGGATATPPPTPPSFNLVGQANTSSITQSENIGQNQPVNAVVVSREVSSQQQADRNAQEQSTF